MQIILNQVEIEQAITDFINSQVAVAEHQQIVIDLVATRGGEGVKATITINDKGTARLAPVSEIAVAPVVSQTPSPIDAATPAKTPRGLQFGRPKPTLVPTVTPSPVTEVATPEVVEAESTGVDVADEAIVEAETTATEETSPVTETIDEPVTVEAVSEAATPEVVPEVRTAPKRSLFKDMKRPA